MMLYDELKPNKAVVDMRLRSRCWRPSEPLWAYALLTSSMPGHFVKTSHHPHYQK